jgi:uncharacterized protein (TIGR02300 family)
MTKPELGAKRLCARCGARFYDLLRTPITCPKCTNVFEPPNVASRFKSEPEPELETEPPANEPEIMSLEDADAEAAGEQRPGDLPEVEDDVELEDAAIIDDGEPDDNDLDEIAGADDENGD